MSRKPKIQVIKIETNRPAFRPKRFPPQPRMYLELIENKAKIKQDLINKEHIPRVVNSSVPIQEDVSYEESDIEVEPQKPIEDSEEEHDKRRIERSDRSDRSDTESEREKSRSDKYERIKRSINKSSSDSEDDSSVKNRKDRRGYKLSGSSSSSDDKDSDSESDDELSRRIKQLLKKDKSASPKSSASSSSSGSSLGRFSRSRDRVQSQPNREVPSLKDLENQGVYQQKKIMRDLNQTSISEQNEEDLKRELLFKFDILKKSYGNVQLPEFTIHSDYQNMLRTYEMTVKKVTLDSNVDTYKNYLIYGFMGVEFVLSNFFKFDMTGFTQQQIVSMSSYEKLLIELGEKSYVPKSSSWPVEVRLLITVLVQAGFFLLTKMLMKKTGANLLGMMNGMNTQSNQPAPDIGAKKRKMKGPDVNLADIPDI